MKGAFYNVIGCFAAMCTLGALAGCADEPTGYGAARIISDPTGAEVVNILTDEALGETPLDLTWEREESVEDFLMVRLEKSGYDADVTPFYVRSTQPSEDAALDDPKVINVQLTRAQ